MAAFDCSLGRGRTTQIASWASIVLGGLDDHGAQYISEDDAHSILGTMTSQRSPVLDCDLYDQLHPLMISADIENLIQFIKAVATKVQPWSCAVTDLVSWWLQERPGDAACFFHAYKSVLLHVMQAQYYGDAGPAFECAWRRLAWHA